MAGEAEARRTAVLGGLAGVVLSAALLWPCLVSSRVPGRGDLPDFFWPMKSYTASRWRETGRPPLWNPLSGCGEPWLAQLQSGVLYPGDAPFFLPWPRGPVGGIALHVVIASAGMALLLWDLGASRPAALLGGAVFAASGPFVSLFPVYNNACSAAWLPWLFAGARRVVEGASLPALAVPSALAFLAGEPALALAGTLAASATAAISAGEGRPGAPYRRSPAAGRLGLSLLLAIGIAAAALFPFADLVVRSGRLGSVTAGEATARPVGASDLADLIVPPSSDALLVPRAERGGYLLTLVLGPAVLLLAAAGGAGLPGRPRFLAGTAAAAAVGMALSLGARGGLAPLLHQAGAGLRFPARWFVFVHFLLALLAGAGLDGWLHGRFDGRLSRVVARSILALAAVATALLVLYGGTSLRDAQGLAAVGLFAALGALLVAFARRTGGRTRVAAAPVVALLGALPLPFLSRGPLAPVPQAAVRSSTPGRLLLPKSPGAARIFPVLSDPALLSTFTWAGGSAWNAEAVARSSSALAGYGNLFARVPSATSASPLGDLGRGRFLGEALRGGDPAAIFDLVDVRWLVTPFRPQLRIASLRPGRTADGVTRWDLPPGGGRLFFPGSARVAPDAEASRLLSRSEAVSRAVAFVPAGPVPRVAGPGWAVAKEVRTLDEEIEVLTYASRPSLLVVSQTFDPGWKARALGAELPVRRVDLFLTGVIVPAGEATILLTYEPVAWRLGLLVSALSLLLAAGLFLGGGALPAGGRA